MASMAATHVMVPLVPYPLCIFEIESSFSGWAATSGVIAWSECLLLAEKHLTWSLRVPWRKPFWAVPSPRLEPTYASLCRQGGDVWKFYDVDADVNLVDFSWKVVCISTAP